MLASIPPFRRSAPRRLARDRRGATAVTMALGITVLLGFAGTAVDIGFWQTTKRNMQGTADQAAYSAVVAAKAGNSGVTSAKGVTAQMGFVDGQNGVTVTVNNPPSSGNYTSNSKAWEVIITKPQPMWFSRLFVASAPVAGARAVALPGIAANYCILVLDPTASRALSLQGSPALNTPSCSIQANSNSPSAVQVGGSASITAVILSAVGNPGYYINSASGKINATIDSAAPALDDPYVAVAVTPSDYNSLPCNYSAVNVANSVTVTLPVGPVRICGGITPSNGGTVVLSGGTYYIDGGSVSIQGGTITSLSGSTLVLTSSTGSNYATMSLTGNANVSITAPSSGKYSGLVIYQDRNAPVGTSNTLTGGAGQNFVGDLYFPNTSVNYGGGASTTSCTHLIAYDATFSCNSNFQSSCADVGNRAIVTYAVNVSE